MRNLAISEVKQNLINVDTGDKICVICMGHSEGQASTKIYVCTHNLNVVHFDDFYAEVWRKSLADVSEPGNLPVDITYLTLSDSLCLALSHGDIVTISGDGSLLERVGVCSDGILAAEWSPDQELLVIVTKALKTLLMPYTFDPPAHEVNLLSEEFGEKQFVTVGWGKKETQFHGSEGKQARVKSEVVPDTITDTDDSVKVTWRGDGQLYAIGFTYEGLRRFKVFDRDGLLQYTSEKQPGLQANMSWRPSGNVIATTQKLPDKYLVAFFEKNGLKHGDFTIPVNSTTTVENISWSYNSEILALQCLDTSDGTQNVLIFTTSNYHWYLKQTLKFEKLITKMVWDNDFDVASHKKLHIILNNGEHYIYNWIWNVDHSYGQTDDDDGIVAVINGKEILVTGFRHTVIPPPMAALTLNVDCQINSIHFALNSDQSNNFFVYTVDEKFVFYNQTNKHPLKYEVINSITLDKYKFPFQYFNWLWANKNTVVCTKIEDGDYYVVEFEINGKEFEIKATTLLASCVTKVHLHPKDSNIIFLQLNQGEIMQYTIGGEISPLEVSFPVLCPMFSVIDVENRVHFLGLSYKNNFYIDDSLVLNNVNSYYVHTHFLLLTTLSHVILTGELTNSGLNAIKDYKKIESPHVNKRKVERGSRLVIAVPNDTRTILQMPRGNLEAIQPRPLSLIIIGKYLDNLKYYEAFDLMRKQRINLNLIYDHDPEKFLLNVDAFLESIKNNSWLSLFLSDLENTDTTTTMYASSYAARQANSTNIDKVVKVCDVIRDRLKNRADCDSKVLPLITTYVKKNTIEDLEMALSLIMKMKEEEGAGAKLPVSPDEALKYLLYMVDVNKLFDIALGMYEFDLVVLVANKSQKDPKEYVSMLNEFNEMEDNYKRFSVNKHLKRFDRAVECLVKCGTSKHEELRNFVKYHSLYKKALDLFNTEDEIFRDISEDFGSYLKLQKQNLEAGLIYSRAKNFTKAVECFKDALEWELAIEIAHGYLEKEGFLELCWDLVTALKEDKRHHEAITILDSYYGNPNETITYCVEAGFYRTAMRLCSQYGKSELKEEKLKPRLMEEYENLNTQIESNWCTFIRQKARLGTVRETKRSAPFEQYDPHQDNRDSDLYSDAGSTIASSASRSSSRTYRSSKNRRKHERKVASLKEGSQYEDVALVMALHTLVTSSFELRPLVREVNVVLTCFGEGDKASTLQRNLDKLLKDMRDSLRDIWTNELVLEATNAAVAALDVPEGCHVVAQGIATLEPHLRIAPVIQEVTWKLEGLD